MITLQKTANQDDSRIDKNGFDLLFSGSEEIENVKKVTKVVEEIIQY